MPDSAEDAELVVAARAGDREAFAAIYDRYADRIHDFCTSTLRDRAEAADAMQETFLVAFERLEQLREPSRLKPWLYAIAHHASLKRARARARTAAEPEMDQMISPDDSPEDEVSRTELSQFVWDAAAGLGARDRALLDLHLRQGLEGKDLAAAVGVTPSHVYVMLNRLRAQVERSLGALLVARTGRRDCPELAGILVGWDGRLTPALRGKVGRHVDGCDICANRRKAVLNPFALLASVPLIPAPASLRDTVIGKAHLAAATRAAGNGFSAGSGWTFDHDGFPRQDEPLGPGAATGQDAAEGHFPPPTSPVPLVAPAATAPKRWHRRKLVVAAVAAAIVLSGGTTAYLAAAADHPPAAAPVAAVGTNPTIGPGPTATIEAPATPGSTDTTAPVPPAAPTATPAAAPGRLTTSTSQLDFGLVGTSLSLLVRNTGGRDLHFVAVASSGALTLTPAAGTLGGGGSGTMTVTFQRAAAGPGPFVAHITVSSDAGHVDIAVSGFVAPDVPNAGPAILRAAANPTTIYTAACAAGIAATRLPSTSAVTATVAGATPISSVTLTWQAPTGSAGSKPMTGNGPTWTGNLGPFDTAGPVQWRVTATDATGKTAMSPPQSVTVQSC